MGWTYNTANPHAATNAPTIAAVGITFTTLSFIVVCLRMYVRGWMIKAIGTDDWIMVFTWFMSLGFMVVTIIQSKWGLGLQNLSDMPDENVFNFGLLQFCGAPFYISSILGFKLSVLFSFLRITVERRYRLTIIIVAVACMAFHLAFLLVQINLCNPVAKQWDPTVTKGSCLHAVPFYTSMASITIVFDVIIMLTPFPMLLKTQLPMRKKVVLLGIFSLGAFITVIQIIRILTIKSLANYIDSSQLIMWSLVENNLGIIITSIPPLGRLFRSFRDKSTNKSSLGGPSRQRGSSYALQSRSYGKGLMVLGSGNDNTGGKGSRDTTVIGLGDIENSSEELSSPAGIYKTTQFVVSRQSTEVDSLAEEQREERKHQYIAPYQK